MLSKIRIDLNPFNDPVIKIEYQSSDDVRDKMVKRFLERFSGVSNWANIDFIGGGDEASEAVITPIHPEYMQSHSIEMGRRFTSNYGQYSTTVNPVATTVYKCIGKHESFGIGELIVLDQTGKEVGVISLSPLPDFASMPKVFKKIS